MYKRLLFGTFNLIRRNLTGWKFLVVYFLFVYLLITRWDSYTDFPQSLLNPNPYSVLHFPHGHINVLPNFMTSNETYSHLDENSTLNLMSLQIPLIVHYFWCKEKPFEFQNYLSILSAYRFLKPTVIIFHYYSKPQLDSYGYYQFYGELLRYIPIVVEEHITYCDDQQKRNDLIFKVLNDRGGIYIGETTILTNPLSWYRNLEFSYSQQFELVLMKHGALQTSSLKNLLRSNPSHIKCVKPEIYQSNNNADCVTVTSAILPKDIVDLNSEFGRLSRWVYFGRKKSRRARIQENKMTPLIVHYIWLGKRPLTFSKYLSLLSAIFVLKADCVYIHGDIKPTGPYWKKAEQIPHVKFIFHDFPLSVFGNQIIKWASHASDVLRADLLIRYGGIYTDWDVLWVNQIPEEIRKYDAVVSADWASAGLFPDIFNLGVLVAQKGSRFLRYFLESYRHYLDSEWLYNAVHIPYKLYEQHTDIVLEYPHLQVICANRRCHPTWLPGYKEDRHFNFNWRTEALSVHITYPDPEEFLNEETLRSSNTMFSEIGKFVMNQAELV